MGARSRPSKPNPVTKAPPPRKWLFLSPAYHWRIIWTKQLISPKLSLRSWLPYVMDLVCLGVFAIWYFSFLPELAHFHEGREIVKADPQNLRILSFPVGLVSIMVPVHAAILRRHRMPQIAEWLWLYAWQVVAWTLFIFAGLLLNLYVDLHGYSYCSYANGENIYARAHAACPPQNNAE